MTAGRTWVYLVLAALLSGCVSQTIKTTSVPAINTPGEAVSEALLLDVGIALFDPGLDDYDEDQRIYPEVRKAEARFMPNLLSQAMQESGAWGAVRVVPDPERISDLSVHGTILYSDGETLELAIRAEDSRGYEWLDKTYKGKASAYAYKASTRERYDPFQAVYNTIANDLLEALDKLRPQDRENVRLTTELLFAQSFSEEAFAGYLARNRSDVYLVMRLPAENDPMLERVRTIRERDHLYIDTMQEYYNGFSSQMAGPYNEWRKDTYDEAVELAEMRRRSNAQIVGGILSVVAGVYGATRCDNTQNDSACRAASTVAIGGGAAILKSGMEKRAEAQIHVQALEELGLSLEAEITPQIIELEDRSITLSGNVEEQYAQWRQLLADIYAAEIGALAGPADDAVTTDTL